MSRMSRALRSICWTSLAIAVLANVLPAQGYASRAISARPAAVSPQRRGAGSPSLTLYGGLATGDGAFDMGPALAASFNWRIADAPFNIRVDPYFAFHSTDGSPDASLWFLGATGNLEYAFRAAGTSAEPYIYGGAGFYYRNLSFDTPGPGDFDDSDMKAALGFGGGVRFGGFTLEAKLQDVDEFTSIAFLVGFRLGG